ncbi:MAG: hypothetical protein AVDCRST_MAG89-2969, partial [uncultured Gemmatimonadetes bacterium]
MLPDAVEASKRLGQTGRSGEEDERGGADGVLECVAERCSAEAGTVRCEGASAGARTRPGLVGAAGRASFRRRTGNDSRPGGEAGPLADQSPPRTGPPQSGQSDMRQVSPPQLVHPLCATTVP